VDRFQGMIFWDYVQLMMLFVFFSTLIQRTLRVRIRRGTNPFKLKFWENRLLGLLELSLFFAVSVWAVEVMFYSIPTKFHIFPWPLNLQLLNSTFAKLSGFIFSVLAFCLFFLGLKNLGDSWQFGIDEHQVGVLVTDGIYCYSRNPIYLFFNFWFLGTFLINGTVVFLCFALFTIGNLHLQILKEERFLRKVHGLEFVEYCKRTPRYFSCKVLAERWKGKPRFSTEF
jgi:protein-S-isoprenylcysteine O-methyltransferase Ste14